MLSAIRSVHYSCRMKTAPHSRFEAITERERGLHRGLTAAQLSMIAIGGAIGTGLFLGSGFAIGPPMRTPSSSSAGLSNTHLTFVASLTELLMSRRCTRAFRLRDRQRNRYRCDPCQIAAPDTATHHFRR
jgi:hypothetical protein